MTGGGGRDEGGGGDFCLVGGGGGGRGDGCAFSFLAEGGRAMTGGRRGDDPRELISITWASIALLGDRGVGSS